VLRSMERLEIIVLRSMERLEIIVVYVQWRMKLPVSQAFTVMFMFLCLFFSSTFGVFGYVDRVC
jgi:hypothetical protein